MLSKPLAEYPEKCLVCGKKLKGRLGQKFCNSKCKSIFNYNSIKQREPSVYLRVRAQLNLNRKILKQCFSSGQLILDKEDLIIQGYNFNYFTQEGKDKNGLAFWNVFEYSLYTTKKSEKIKLKILNK